METTSFIIEHAPAIAQMMTACAAVAAMFVGPSFAFKNGQRTLLATSRQQWLDAIRDDVSVIVSLHTHALALRKKVEIEDPRLRPPDTSEIFRETSRLATRVRFRLNMERTEHLALQEAISNFVCSEDLDEPAASPRHITLAMDAIVDGVWTAIKAGRV